MTATIREVARAAGVSVATVSRVLNASSPVTDSTRRRVEAAVSSLRYVPHSGARSLITRRTDTFGALLPDLYGDFFSEVIRGLDQSASAHGYHLLIAPAHSDLGEFEAALRAMRGRVDGLVIMSPDLGFPAIRANLPENLPVVLVNSPARPGEVDAINIDNAGGARAIVQHLIAHRHRRIAIITGPRWNTDACERLNGYHRALAEANLPRAAGLEVAGDFTEDSGYEAARVLLAMATPPSAVFAANDSMAIGAMSAVNEAGRRIPGDIAIVGFDDIPIAGYTSPPLSSVHVPISELGVRAVERLVAAVQQGSRHVRTHDVLTATPVIRQTCGLHDYNHRRQAEPARRRSFSSPLLEAAS